jgi:ComF family protein
VIKVFKEIKNMFFMEDICLICKDKKPDYRTYICNDCYINLEIVDKENYMDLQYIKKTYYSVLYNRYLREQMTNYKFNGKSYLYKVFGEIMVDTIKKKEIQCQTDLIIYIPSHRRKEALRGYNPAELLASYISKDLKIPVSKESLVKNKWTKDQSKLNRLDRTTNLTDSFYIKNKEEIKGRKILLIDDIITTGATLQEVSKVLIQNGVKEIIGLTLTASKI